MSGVVPRRVLLDTCAIIWLANGDPFHPDALDAVRAVARTESLYVSTVSAWEIGLLSRPTRDEARRLQFAPDPKTWFRNVLAGPGIKHAPLTPDIAVDSSFLPGDIHGDPVDRLILATARHLGAAVVTRDRHIIQYGATGFVDVIAC